MSRHRTGEAIQEALVAKIREIPVANMDLIRQYLAEFREIEAWKRADSDPADLRESPTGRCGTAERSRAAIAGTPNPDLKTSAMVAP